MRRKSSGLRVLHFFWVACLLAPPATRLWLDVSEETRRESEPKPSGDGPTGGLSAATVASGDVLGQLREMERDLRALDVTLVSEEYEPVLARVLLEDPSPFRHAFLVGIRSRKPVPPDTTAITVDHRLLGRVLDVVDPPLDTEGFAVAQVQTILDRSFRVSFVVGKARGLAAGTGDTTADGHPLLEILLLDGPRELQEGEMVRTDATGGVFAPGISIGSILLEADDLIHERRNRLPVIRSEIVLGGQRQVVLLRDSMRLSAARVTTGNKKS